MLYLVDGVQSDFFVTWFWDAMRSHHVTWIVPRRRLQRRRSRCNDTRWEHCDSDWSHFLAITATWPRWDGTRRWPAVDGAVVQRPASTDFFYFRFRPVSRRHATSSDRQGFGPSVSGRALIAKQVCDRQFARRRRRRHHHVVILVIRRAAAAAAARRVIKADHTLIPRSGVWRLLVLAGSDRMGGLVRCLDAEVRRLTSRSSSDAPLHQVSLELFGADVQAISQLTYRRLFLQHNTNWRHWANYPKISAV